MKNPLVFIILGVILLAFVASPSIALKRMIPPHLSQYKSLNEEIQEKYLKDGKLPATMELSPSAQQTLAANVGITYTPEKGSSYLYDKTYPENLPLIGLVTFGLCWGGENKCAGEKSLPENLIYNAKLRVK